MLRNFPINGGGGQISANKLRGKSKFHCKRTVKVLNSCEKLSKGPWIVWHQKTSRLSTQNYKCSQTSTFSRSFERTIKLKRSAKISEFTHHSKKSLSTSPGIVKSCISKHEDSPCFNCLTQDAHRLGKEKSNMDKGEMEKPWCFLMRKSFNLDEPDGSQCYWHDLRKEKQPFSKRPFGGGSVMVWGAFSASAKADLEVMEGKQNSARYINVLEKSLFFIYELSRHQ